MVDPIRRYGYILVWREPLLLLLLLCLRTQAEDSIKDIPYTIFVKAKRKVVNLKPKDVSTFAATAGPFLFG